MLSAIRRLYDGAPVVVQDALISLYGLHLRRLRYGRMHARMLAELLESQWHDAARVEASQRARLASLVKHARETTEFYGGLPAFDARDPDALLALPLLTKDQVREAGDAIVSRAYRGRRLTEIHTGGTTGKPLSIRCTPETLRRNYAFFSRFQSWTGFRRGERVATFAGRNLIPARQDDSGVYWRRNRAANTLLLSSYHISPRNLPRYAEALARFQPALIDSYPSSITPVARHLLDAGIRVRPKAIITSSETLEPDARALLERAFACPVFDHYGAAEMAALITQCERGTYHANPEFGAVEVLAEDGRPVPPGGTGQIVATGFINEVMPLIRYATGDLAVRGHGTCGCGRAFPVIERVIGRRDDVVITPDGRRIGRLDPIFKVVSGVVETQIVQTHRDRLRVEIVPAAGFDPIEGARLRDELLRRVGGAMTVEIVPVERIARARSGKLRTVVNLVDRAPDDESDS